MCSKQKQETSYFVFFIFPPSKVIFWPLHFIWPENWINLQNFPLHSFYNTSISSSLILFLQRISEKVYWWVGKLFFSIYSILNNQFLFQDRSIKWRTNRCWWWLWGLVFWILGRLLSLSHPFPENYTLSPASSPSFFPRTTTTLSSSI